MPQASVSVTSREMVRSRVESQPFLGLSGWGHSLSAQSGWPQNTSLLSHLNDGSGKVLKEITEVKLLFSL